MTLIKEAELLATDRCDQCAARAMVRATFSTGALYFCGHHARETGYTLALKAKSIYDPEGLLEHGNH
jgi:hypothetical protein